MKSIMSKCMSVSMSIFFVMGGVTLCVAETQVGGSEYVSLGSDGYYEATGHTGLKVDGTLAVNGPVKTTDLAVTGRIGIRDGYISFDNDVWYAPNYGMSRHANGMTYVVGNGRGLVLRGNGNKHIILDASGATLDVPAIKFGQGVSAMHYVDGKLGVGVSPQDILHIKGKGGVLIDRIGGNPYIEFIDAGKKLSMQLFDQGTKFLLSDGSGGSGINQMYMRFGERITLQSDQIKLGKDVLCH